MSSDESSIKDTRVEIRRIKAKISQIKGLLTRTTKFANEQRGQVLLDTEGIQLRLEMLQTSLRDYKQLALELQLLLGQDAEQYFAEDVVEDRCLTLMAELRNISHNATDSTPATPKAHSQPGLSDCHNKRLPHLELPVFDVITGSTDGIGKQYALELAQRGINVVLVSRNPDKLKSVAEQIEKLHSVKTKTIVADFGKGAEVYQHIENELKDVPVGILVNNVGNQYEYPMPLCELPRATACEIINVNVVAVTAMTRMLLPAMAARGRGAVVNVSSGSELQPLPLMAVYAATKVYVRNFTLAVREEYAPLGVHVQHVSPLFVSTKMNTFSQRLLDGNLLVPDARTYARHAVSTLGRVHTTTGYWLHGIQYFFIKLAPEWIRIKIGAHMNRGFREEHMQKVKAKAQ